ncbi:MAG: hypothetical protein EOP49_15715 [Sphingobacteriales bacterium]|nr:MAG: hypothetical protein EOP49_15715 [Sphingobacteriales bacterium]
MVKYFVRFGLCALMAAATLTSCGDKSADKAADVSEVKISYTAHPFYKDFAKLDPNHVATGLEGLKKQYPEFLDFYLDTLVGFGFHGRYSDSNRMMHDFLTMKDYRDLLDTVVKAFPNTDKYDGWLKQTFQYMKHYDNSFRLPEHVYYFVSYLNGMTAILQSDKNIGVGLDMFLGRDYFPYKQLSISDYATIRMTDENIPVWVARALYEEKYPFISDDRDLLNMMMQRGRQLYFLEKVTPYLKDEVRFGFTHEQMEWCKKNEALIYNFFISNNLLFEKNTQKIMRYVSDGPTSAGMPIESPGNTASYIGWIIVKRYAEQNNLSMHDLLEIKDPQKILEGAKYKP